MNKDIVDVYLNANTCIICGIIIRKGETYCEGCKELKNGFKFPQNKLINRRDKNEMF